MKATADKSSHAHSTSATLKTQPSQPFFAKAGGDFFAPATVKAPPSVQTKLAVNTPGDKYEVEADHMADKVMRMSVSGKHGHEKDLETHQKNSIQRKESNATSSAEEPLHQGGNSTSSVTSAQTETAIKNKTSGGQSLPAETRSFMEPRFGNDFSNVRIHHDQGAEQLNNQLNAKAFTYQNHIFFGAGQYQPQSPRGKQLLAHELTHVVQQGAANGPAQNTEKLNSGTETTLQRQPIQTGSSGIQRGLLDDAKQGASAVAGALGDIINNVREAIGGGISAATAWIRNIASAIGSGIVEAWTFIRNVATNIRLGVAAAWTFIQGIASGIGQAVTSAWTWIRGLATRINMGITNSWKWIQGAAARVGKGITASWNWIQTVASRVAQGITNSWNLIQSIASRLAMAITNAWNWVQDVASNIAMSITSAWNWIQATAARLGQRLPASWGWVKVLASRLAMGITNAWNWVQSMASGMAMAITNAWNLIQNIASRIAQNITNAWNWVQSVARNLALAITNAWNWVQAAASRLAMAITDAWNWIQAMARQVGMVIIRAWNLIIAFARKLIIDSITEAWKWIQTFTRKLSMMITRALDWVIAMALKIGKAIISGWNWLVDKAKQLGKMIVGAWQWIVNMAKTIGKAILQAWNWLVNFAKNVLKGIMSLLKSWDYYLRAPDFTIETQFNAPDGSGRLRSKIGVGEKVTFKGSKIGDWSATGGSPGSLASTDHFVWTAPNRGASVSVSLTSGKYTKTKEIVVLEPSAVTGRRTSVLSYDPGTMGAGMQLKFLYNPKNVSFANIEAGEVSGPPSGVEGYFTKFQSKLDHDSGDQFFPLQINNENTATDTAAIRGFPRPWSIGKFKWIIPNRFRVHTEGGDGKIFATVEQAFTLEGGSGKTKVTKAGTEVSRTP